MIYTVMSAFITQELASQFAELLRPKGAPALQGRDEGSRCSGGFLMRNGARRVQIALGRFWTK